MNIKKKAAVYVVSEKGMLIFSHPDHPEVGFQVPSGTVREDETVASAAVRELEEETGLCVLESQLEPLPTYTHDMRPFREEEQERYPFLLRLSDGVVPRWSHWEQHPDTPGADPVLFEFHWEPINKELPLLLAVGQGRPIRHLCMGSVVSGTSRLEYRALRALVYNASAARRHDISEAVAILFPKVSYRLSPALQQDTMFGAILEHVAYLARRAADGEENLVYSAELLSAAIECISDQKHEVLVLDSNHCLAAADHGYETPLLLATARALRGACTTSRPEYVAAFRMLKRLAFTDTVDGSTGIVVELQHRQLLEATDSYTLSGLPGTIYCDCVASEVRLAETLLHESTHTWLNRVFATLQPNGFSAKEYWSPWRHKLRPAYGILQATLVFSLLCQFFDRCMQSDDVRAVDRAYACSRLHVEMHVLRSNLDTLSVALKEMEDQALRTVISEELNRAINLGS